MRREASSYWKALAAVAVVSAVANAVVTNVFVAVMTPANWGERVIPALGWSLLLTALTTLFVLIGTVWLRSRHARPRWLLALLASAGPAVAWTIIGLFVGDWLFPVYAFYGLGAGIVAGGVLTACLTVLGQLGAKRPVTVDSA